jgi:hypothetical protein
MKEGDPKVCSATVHGKPCTNTKIFYKIGRKGFCENHKPTPQMLKDGNSRIGTWRIPE